MTDGMSFNDPGFLFSNRPTDREREAERQVWEEERQFVGRCYKRATWLVVLAMVFVAAPTGLEKWHWHVVGGVAFFVTLLGILMLWRRAFANGLICFVFAWGILPSWIYIAPTALSITKEQYQIIAKEWRRVL
jgi:hypothetical protein